MMVEPDLMDKEWRYVNLDWTLETRDKLRKDICEYQPLYLRHVNIMLVGPIGAGKSSIFNTINSTFQGHVTGQAQSGSSGKSLTRTYRKYPVRTVKGGEPLNFRLCDTIGLEMDEIDPGEFKHILDGNLPDRYQFNPGGSITDKVAGYKTRPGLKDRIHVVAMCVDGSSFTVIPDKDLDLLKKIKKMTSEREIPLMVVMTKVDKICAHVTSELSHVYNSKEIFEKVQDISTKLGVPKSHITVVKNYESETDCQLNVDILALTTVRQMLRLADNFLDDQPEREAWERTLDEPRDTVGASSSTKAEALAANVTVVED